MAGFSLGGRGGGSGRGGGGQDTNESIPFIYTASNPTTTSNTRGFELWHQQQQHHHQFYASPPTMLGFSSTSSDNKLVGPAAMRGSSSGGGISCQDCGNQAKKDCSHMRCRTCCKSRGFHCATHVKSTWVPASRRRERQLQLASAAARSLQQQQQQQLQQRSDLVRSGSGGSGDGSKRPRELFSSSSRAITATATAAAAAAASSAGGMEVVNFPAEVSWPAVFRCVRVSSMEAEAAEDEFAYQTAVNIGGHVFKGILYDQGPESQYQQQQQQQQQQLHHHGESSSSSAAVATSAAAAGTTNVAIAGSTGLMDPSSSSMYPTPLSAFMAGTQFFPHHPRPSN